MSVDGRVCSVGSANLDITAGYWEIELLLIVDRAVQSVERDDWLLARHGPGREQARAAREEAPQDPVQPGPQVELPAAVPEAAGVRGIEADLPDGGWERSQRRWVWRCS